MRFRPCIDIHDGRVKQIVGATLTDTAAAENFVSDKTAADYAALYRADRLTGGHVILLNPAHSPQFEATRAQALAALAAYPGGLQVGGGITADNAAAYLDAGASHVIVTSYIFVDGQIRYDRLTALRSRIGKQRLVCDLSCRRRGDAYYIVTDRWQKFTEVAVTPAVLDELAAYCDEFLFHAVDVEGRQSGIEQPLVTLLGQWSGLPVTYAGGVHTLADLQLIDKLSGGRLDVTVGSALDLFGGPLPYRDVLAACSPADPA